ncbi:uncharacterized protein EV154DRAFT_560533 [Mucor mucedo]|uniref:uncharacterized protein n=1 Tax=Mucor mucedo TaxID=29922 RepID=UPI00221F92DE|nr:uncharacterized protein EV154DRAFT_560533 [Mucor mucedo]KAI7894300.1 hypothetical protein EV154DRAFT_560533 [Mucor mucedo]
MSNSTSATASDATSQIVWGFMFENSHFTEFERRNHPIIEAAYHQRKKKHSSHHITITDANLPKPGKAKVYFGVAQNHLRMPGTRYYVKRCKSISSSPPQPMLVPSPSSTFSSFSSMDTASFTQPSRRMQQFNSNTLAAVLSDFTPLLEVNYEYPSTIEYSLADNMLYYSNAIIKTAPMIPYLPTADTLPMNSNGALYNTNASLNNSVYMNNNTPPDSTSAPSVSSSANLSPPPVASSTCLSYPSVASNATLSHPPITSNTSLTHPPMNNTMNMFIPDLNTFNMMEDPNWINNILSLAPSVSWSSSALDTTYFHNLMTN